MNHPDLSCLDPALRRQAAAVRLLALDIDGTLTDGRLYIGSQGEELKAFQVADGLGIKLVRSIGIEVALITARRSPLVAIRARELGLEHVIQGCRDKRMTLDLLRSQLGLRLEQIAYMGDDLPDLPALTVVGLATAPANAHPWVAERVHWQSRAAGGDGAVRELCDLLIAAQGRQQQVLAPYLEPPAAPAPEGEPADAPAEPNA
jgi:3-deoxy-D-manno-octulosonate 8-phosphate phosphatase (KDO 8-P phosphatase)